MAEHTLTEIAALTRSTLEGDGSLRLSGAATLLEATPGDISFLVDSGYRERLEASQAGAVIVPADFDMQGHERPVLRCEDPNRAFSVVVRHFAPEPYVPRAGVHPSAVVEQGAELGQDVAIDALCYVGAGARLGRGVQLHPGASVGRGASIGEETVLMQNVVVYPHARIGARCIMHGGVVIGADGFGYERGPNGWERVFQGGTVVIGDEVDIGANSTVDRARVGATRIGNGVKLDNLVHLGHNVQVGDRSLFAGQVGISGSTRIGEDVMLGGQVGVAGHLQLGDGMQAAGRTAIFEDQPPGVRVGGWPARPLKEFWRIGKRMKVLLDLEHRLRRMSDRIEHLEQQLGARGE